MSIMNEKNVSYLKDNLKYMGFGDKLNSDLEKNINEGSPEFQLKVNEKMYKGNVEATLNFKKSPSSEMYFFNSYMARFTNDKGIDRTQQFNLNNGKGVTLKEAYNLLDGRAVLKDLTNREGEKYQAWMKIDFSNSKSKNHFEIRQFHAEKYGFNLEGELGKLNLTTLPEDKEKQLMQSLQKGNLQAVNFIKDGKETPMYIEANPQFKAINVYDPSGHQLSKFEKEQFLNPSKAKLTIETGLPIKESSVNQMEKVQNQKQDMVREVKQVQSPEIQKKSQNQNRGVVKNSKVRNIKDLLPQKKRSAKKGLKIS